MKIVVQLSFNRLRSHFRVKDGAEGFKNENKKINGQSALLELKFLKIPTGPNRFNPKILRNSVVFLFKLCIENCHSQISW